MKRRAFLKASGAIAVRPMRRAMAGRDSARARAAAEREAVGGAWFAGDGGGLLDSGHHLGGEKLEGV